MIIGYQGDVGSNSEAAAKRFVEENSIADDVVEFRPLVSSKNVITELKRGSIDIAVLAFKNSIAGTVAETYLATKDEYFKFLGSVVLPIEHCICKRKDAETNDLRMIASHIQALRQTAKWRENRFPNLEEMEVADTALAAKKLAEGSLPKDCAVICRKNAAELYGLDILFENVYDVSGNETEFRVLGLPQFDYENTNKPSFKENFSFHLVNESVVGTIIKFFSLIIMLAIYFIPKLLDLYWWLAIIISAVNSAGIIGILTSTKFKNKIHNKQLIGYWKYVSKTDNYVDDKIQNFSAPRIVKVFEEDGILKFIGYKCDRDNVPFFESYNVIVSPVRKQKNNLVYWYKTPREGEKTYGVTGIVDLTWSCKYPAATINKMSGHYIGRSDSGSIEYLRINEDEYRALKNSLFL